jgi:hypothetical protein
MRKATASPCELTASMTSPFWGKSSSLLPAAAAKIRVVLPEMVRAAGSSSMAVE